MNVINLSEARIRSERGHVTTDDHRTRWPVNLVPLERIGRIVIGVAAVLAGVVLLGSAGTLLATLLEILLVAAGLDLAITGALGHCPLYARLGHIPKSLRRPS